MSILPRHVVILISILIFALGVQAKGGHGGGGHGGHSSGKGGHTTTVVVVDHECYDALGRRITCPKKGWVVGLIITGCIIGGMILICLAYWAVSSLKSFVQRFKASRAAKRQPAYVAVDTAATPSPFAKGISNKDIFEPPAAHSNDDRDSILPLYRPNDQYDPPPSPKSGYKVVFPEPDHKLDAKAEP